MDPEVGYVLYHVTNLYLPCICFGAYRKMSLEVIPPLSIFDKASTSQLNVGSSLLARVNISIRYYVFELTGRHFNYKVNKILLCKYFHLFAIYFLHLRLNKQKMHFPLNASTPFKHVLDFVFEH